MDLSWWIVYVGIPLISLLFAVDFYIHKNANDEREKLITEKNTQIRELRTEKDTEIAVLHARLNNVNKEFSDYKVNAAMLFSTVTAVTEVKKELVGAMTSMKGELSTGQTLMKTELSAGLTYIAQRLDRIVERNDRKDNS